jgi:hypothetical protein
MDHGPSFSTMLKFRLLLIILLCPTLSLFGQSAQVRQYCIRINLVNTMITNGATSRQKAEEIFKTLLQKIKAGSNIKSNKLWVFPLQGYSANAIGGLKGSGYNDKGYNYLDGNKHIAHPAHDIFINDKDHNDRDDRTKKPVSVLAVTDGVVLACTNLWEPGSLLRGGKYIWLYHPQLKIITYYAHNQAIFVSPGDVVKQGQKIAEVGRTGFNAYQKRSPTHLHFSSFRLVNSMPVPFNCYTNLVKAKS